MRIPHLIEAFERGDRQLLRETLLSRPSLTLGLLYLPPDAGMSFQPTPEVDRLHFLVRGRATLVHDVSQLRLEAGQAAGVAAPQADVFSAPGPRGATTGPRGATTGPRSSAGTARSAEEGHRLRTGESGCLFLSLALRRTEAGVLLQPKPLSVFELRGAARSFGCEELHTWAARTAFAHKLRLLMPPTETRSPYEAVPGMGRSLLVLAGELELETPQSLGFLPELAMEELAPDEPHRLRSSGTAPALVLALTDAEAMSVRYASLACGPHGRGCTLVPQLGDGLVLLDDQGRIQELSPQAQGWLGLMPGALLQSGLALEAREWLTAQLGQAFPAPPAQKPLTGPGLVPGLVATFLPYRGGERLAEALLHLRIEPQAAGPTPSASLQEVAVHEQVGSTREDSSSHDVRPSLRASPEEASEAALLPALEPLPSQPEWVVVSAEMHKLRARLEKLSLSQLPLLVAGPAGSGRSMVVDQLLSLRRAEEARTASGPTSSVLRRLDARLLGESELRTLLLERSSPQAERHARPGPAFQGLSPGVLVLEHLEALSISAASELLKALGTLLTRGVEGARPGTWLIVELEKVPLRYLAPTTPQVEGIPQRGAFCLLEVPALASRKEALGALLSFFLKRASGQANELSPEALELLHQASWPDELRGLERLARALSATQVRGVVTAGALRGLLEQKQRPSWLEGMPDVPTLDEAERTLLLLALKQAGGNRAEVARILGITRTRLYRMLAEHGLG